MTKRDDNVRPRRAAFLRLGALLLALATVAPAMAWSNAAVYLVDGKRDYLLVAQQPDNFGLLREFDLRIGNGLASASYHVPAQPTARFDLREVNGTFASGAWVLHDDFVGLGSFAVEVHITNRAGHDGARPCQGGYSAIGGHPQVYLHTIVWLEPANACAVESQRP